MGRILGASKVTVRFQVTIPAEVRKLMKIKEGQTLVFVDDNGKIVIRTEA
jgi:AbrB family looped-hinge helix DNA binding protein